MFANGTKARWMLISILREESNEEKNPLKTLFLELYSKENIIDSAHKREHLWTLSDVFEELSFEARLSERAQYHLSEQ